MRQNGCLPLERSNVSLQGLSVVSPQIAWMSAGYGPPDEHHGMVWRTVDGGLIWEQKVFSVSGNDQLPPDLPYLAVAAVSADEAWVVSAHNNTQGSSIYYTADGGDTWTLQGKNMVSPFDDLNDIRILEGVIWIAGDSSTVFRSANFGGKWEKFNTPSSGYNMGIAALDGVTAWAVSSGGGALEGATVRAVSSVEGIISGDIVNTGDSGKKWDKQSYPPQNQPPNSFRMWPLNPRRFLAHQNRKKVSAGALGGH